uniref:NADH-ubiquinone oxidoreductase chain 4 n=1 Tax=Penthimia melanocephala TaxID=2777567 RepID=A0A7L8UXF7_9HEMI|nr:NADH dehydrogenase subunit 4 [Penthimia melanocephala]QOG08896.1 NADH dehydrogenase subunit 4 [Penthimia melanocephala]
MFMYLLFMIPLFMMKKFVYYIQFMYLIMYFFFMTNYNINSFYSGVSYSLGFDIFSYGLILLSLIICCLMSMTVFYTSYLSIYFLVNIFLLVFLLLIFSSLNFLYMYISFEFILFPLMILILGWGYQPERLISGLYLFFYTLVASLPFLCLIIYCYIINGSFFFDYLFMDKMNFFIHLFSVFAFFIKMPMFFFHFWLPKAHVQAPVSGSMILAGLMLKIGGYGLIRVMFIYEYLYVNYSYIWYSLSLLGSLYIGLLCLFQGDMKCMVAYSSVAHMGLCILGFLTMSSWGTIGSYLLMLGHGFCSSGMFYMVNVFYLRSHSRSFYMNKGILLYMPSCSFFWFLLCCFNMSCPPSINFISEFFILVSMNSYWSISLMYFLFISFFCACFSYYLYSYMHNGLYHNLYSFSSMMVSEMLCLFMHLIPLFGLIFFMMIMI